MRKILLIFLCACNPELPKEERLISGVDSSVTKPVIEIKTFQDTLGWGYDVYVAHRMYIHQPHIPAIAGNRGFTSEVSAHKTAEFIAYKIRKNIMPPSVTAKELDSLGVLE